MVLKERIRRLEDAKSPQAAVDLDRVELIRGMIRTGRRRADLNADEMSLYDSHARLEKSLFECTAIELRVKLRVVCGVVAGAQ